MLQYKWWDGKKEMKTVIELHIAESQCRIEALLNTKFIDIFTHPYVELFKSG